MNAQTNHRTRWTAAEDEFLLAEFDHHRETTEVIAELLGRTVNACAQRWYELSWGTAVEPVVAKPEPGAPSNRPTISRVQTIITFEVDPATVCPACFTIRSASGSCFCD